MKNQAGQLAMALSWHVGEHVRIAPKPQALAREFSRGVFEGIRVAAGSGKRSPGVIRLQYSRPYQTKPA